MTMTAAEAASSPPAIHAGAVGQDLWRRPERPPRPLSSRGPAPAPVPSGRGPGLVTAPDAPATPGSARATSSSVRTTSSSVRAAPATPGPVRAAPATAPDTACVPPSSASRRLAVGRSPGCLARQPATSRRKSPGRSLTSAGLLTSRYMSAALVPEPNGPAPRHANTSTAPKLKMSLAGPASWPRTCSGDKNPGDRNPGDRNPGGPEPGGPEPASGRPPDAAACQISRGPSPVSRT
jgi:hypothetical protein